MQPHAKISPYPPQSVEDHTDILIEPDPHPEYLSLAEHLAIGDASPHHAALTLVGADIALLLAFSGAQGLTLQTQTMNKVFASPASGGAVAPGFRALVLNDLPSGLSGIIDHGSLLGLTDDDHSQYALLVGRAGSQTLNVNFLGVGLGVGGSPGAPLHLRLSGVASNMAILESTSDSSNIVIALKDSSPSQVRVAAFNFLDDTGSAAGQLAYFFDKNTPSNQYMRFNVTSSEKLAILQSGDIRPGSNDGGSLGISAKAFSDLFLASGGVINFNAGDVLITHSADLLAFSGAASGYTFDARVGPNANDGAALGVSGTAWADLFLASGAVLNFNAGDVTLTHASNKLTLAGGNLELQPNGSFAASRAFACMV